MARTNVYDDRASVQSVMLQKIRRTVCVNLPAYQWQEMDVHAQIECVSGKFTFLMESFFAGKEEETTDEHAGTPVYFPQTWWDAVKQRWFPAWLEKIYPVKFFSVIPKTFKTTKITRICPHMEVSPGDRDHFEYLVYDRIPNRVPGMPSRRRK